VFGGAWEVAHKIARRQHGAITHAQLRAAGMSEDQIYRAQKTGLLIREHRGVYLMAGVAAGWRPKLMCATLAGGSIATAAFRAANALWELPHFQDERLEVMIPFGHQYQAQGVRVHRSRCLPAVDITVVDGIRVTSLARTVIDMATICTFEQLQDIADEACRRPECSPHRLRWRLSELGGPGRKGSTNLARILHEYTPGTKRPESPLERRFHRLFEGTDIPMPVIRPSIRVATNITLEPDAGWLEWYVLAEVNSRKYHEIQSQLLNDEERRALFAAAGYLVVPVRAPMIDRQPERVRGWFRDALLSRGWRPPG